MANVATEELARMLDRQRQLEESGRLGEHVRGAARRGLAMPCFAERDRLLREVECARFDFFFQLGPAGEAVLAGERELSGRERELSRDAVDARARVGVAGLRGVEQVLGLVAELVEVGPEAPSRVYPGEQQSGGSERAIIGWV